MRNLARLTNAANRIEAWRDWQKLAQEAADAGRADVVSMYAPREDAGWRMIDRRIAALRKALGGEQ